jgi:CBS domain containing-hemolysin-like protein
MVAKIDKLGEVQVRQIMQARVSIISVSTSTDYQQLLEIIRESGYSRIPVYENDLDSVTGLLHVKDLIGLEHEKNEDYAWQKLIRTPVLYVPEAKKIDQVLGAFQTKRQHLAIVVDEYGGTNGILTLEDIVEEVIGDIKDEFDEAEPESTILKIADGIYVASGKNTIDELCIALELVEGYFEEVKGEAETIGGLVLEILGRIPKATEQAEFQSIKFTVMKVANNRIEDVRIELL